MKKILVIVSSFVSFLVVGSCGGSSGDSSKELFYNAARQTTPAITAAVSVGSVSVNALTPGSAGYEIYNLMRDYNNETDDGVIDMTNMYKMLYEAGNGYENAVNGCSSVAEVEIDAPYDLGLTDTYDCRGATGTMSDNYAYGFAIREESAGTKHVLVGFRWAPTPAEQLSHGVMQGTYNETTGDLNIRALNNVVYPSSSGFTVRTHIEGNKDTHAFTLNSIVGTLNAGHTAYMGSYTIVGKGVSRGAGNYFLFKIGTDYYCIKADATETDLESLTPATPVELASGDCSTYKDAVDDITPLTTSELPKTIADFTNNTAGSILLDN